MKLVIDAGHGGYDSGAVGNGLVEKNLTLQIARRVRLFLYRNVLILPMLLVRIILFHFILIAAGVQVLKAIFIMRYPTAALHMQSNKRCIQQ